MKLRKLIFLLILINIAVFAYGNIHIVDVNKLPNNEAFNRNMQTLFNMNDYVNHYSFDWKYPVDKVVLIEFLTAFHNDINRTNNRNDYELNLLDVVLMTYLYNLDELEYFNIINEKINKMKLDSPGDYRSYWILGNFLVNATRTIDGYNEFLQIIKLFNTRLEDYPAYFLRDYAYACILAQMPENGKKIYELAARIGGTPLDSNVLYKSTVKGFVDASANNNYSDNDVWQIFESGNKYYIRSRMFGSLFPLVSSWNVSMLGLNNRRSLCVITPDRLISRNNNAISITVLIEYYLNDDLYENFLKERLNTYPVISQSKRTINNREYDVLIFEDKSIYQNMGGCRGYYISTQLKFDNQDNTSIELPIQLNLSGESGTSYYTLRNSFHRINQNINVGILVDASNEIFNEATLFIFDYLNKIILE